MPWTVWDGTATFSPEQAPVTKERKAVKTLGHISQPKEAVQREPDQAIIPFKEETLLGTAHSSTGYLKR